MASFYHPSIGYLGLVANKRICCIGLVLPSFPTNHQLDSQLNPKGMPSPSHAKPRVQAKVSKPLLRPFRFFSSKP